MKKYALRSLVVIFWTLLLMLILYFPKIESEHLEENSITIFTWGDILEPSVIEAFEKETGIKVYMNYYSSNEEMLVKLKATRAEGYDLIVPSDYAVRLLIREKLLQPLDHSRILFWQDLNPRLLHHFFDPENRFSIPFSWEVYGFGIDTDFFAGRDFPKNWGLVFDKNVVDYRIGMVNEPLDAISFASLYLFGPQETTLNTEQQQSVLDLLRMQRNWVEVYASFRGDYLLATKNCPVVLASSSYIWRTMRAVPFVQFIVPEEGTYINIENLCIPVASKKQDLVYRLMNYLYTTQSSATHFATYGIFPATIHTDQWPAIDPLAARLINSPEEFDHFHFLDDDLLPPADLRNMWVEVKTE